MKRSIPLHHVQALEVFNERYSPVEIRHIATDKRYMLCSLGFNESDLQIVGSYVSNGPVWTRPLAELLDPTRFEWESRMKWEADILRKHLAEYEEWRCADVAS